MLQQQSQHQNETLQRNTLVSKSIDRLKQFHNFINPQTIFSDGTPRLISVDVMRGIAIFAMIMQHETFGTIDIDAVLNYPMPKVIASYIIGIPIMIFANWRTFIVLISGITNGFTQMKAKSVRQLSIDTVKRTLGSFCIFPVFFAIEWLFSSMDNPLYPIKNYNANREQLIQNNPQQKKFYDFPQNVPIDGIENPFVEPWFITFNNESGAPIFYGCTTILLNIINYVVQAPILFIKQLKLHHQKYTYSIIFVLLAMIFSFTTHFVHYNVYKHYITKFPTLLAGKEIECIAGKLRETIQNPTVFQSYYGTDKTYRDQSNQAFQILLLMFINGHNTFMFPMWSNIMLGSAFGCLLSGFYEQQKITPKRQWNKTRKYLILTMFCCLVIPIIMYGISRAIAQNQFAVGKRTKVQSYLNDLLNLKFENLCMMPEYLHVETTIQFICVIILVLIFDAKTEKKAYKHAQRSLYLRRFSTGSMTCYSFSYLLGHIIKSVFWYNPKEIGYYYGFMVLYFVVQLFLFIALDHADWIMTPDWFLSAIPKVLQGKLQKDVYARDSHLKIRPVLVLEKFEEDAIAEEETRTAQTQVAAEQEVLTVEAAAK
ncbi:Transmembrane_domain-containing protein [Hexamita inflata]|uniref:Transmembrane domain-containing protein n=2 Tax=Hexamita inflata TaxID=28002 RepID=A0AA86QYK1_9EUKA|nr:Transmembrane domain-containing protein [Hexamita inflata]